MYFIGSYYTLDPKMRWTCVTSPQFPVIPMVPIGCLHLTVSPGTTDTVEQWQCTVFSPNACLMETPTPHFAPMVPARTTLPSAAASTGS